MLNILDFIGTNKDKKICPSNLNLVDNAVFCELSYINFEKIIPKYPTKETTNLYTAINTYLTFCNNETRSVGLLLYDEPIKIAEQILNTERYKDILVSNYINLVDQGSCEQFSATTFVLDKNTVYIAIRGTDDTISGWIENLSFSAVYPVKSEICALKYVNTVASLYPYSKIYIGGHSKGGILAEYAFCMSNAKLQERVIKTFSNDGLGVNSDFVDNTKYLTLKSKIIKLIPSESVIGSMFHTYYDTKILSTDKKGLLAHRISAWETNENGFVETDKISEICLNATNRFNDLIQSVNIDEKYKLIRELKLFNYRLGFNTLTEAKLNFRRTVKEYKKIDKDTKNWLKILANIFIKTVIQ